MTTTKERTAHLLICLVEECQEVSKEACKVLRFGPDDTFGGAYAPARTRLALELAELIALHELVVDTGLILPLDRAIVEQKKLLLVKMMQYSQGRGLVDPLADKEL